MLNYIIQRLLQAIPVLLLASVPIFLILHMAPGDPALILAGEYGTEEDIAEIRRYLGLDQPLIVQYFTWLWRVLHGDLGISFYQSGTSVAELIGQRLPATLELAIAGLILSIIISVPLGIIAAVKKGRWPDHLIMGASSVSIAIPNFWLGILMLLLFAVFLGWLPAGGRPVTFFEDPLRSLEYLLLPAFTLSLFSAAVLVRFVRASMLEVLNQDYIRTAYSKGLSYRTIITKHALRNALIPAITALGVQLGQLLTGTIVLELVFSWPGLGQLILGAITGRDYQLVQGCVLMFVVTFVIVNLLTDIIYGVLDPRISVTGK